MARLPQPGGDDGSWGSILNDYLSQSLNADGTLKDGIVTFAQLAPNAVTGSALNIAGGTDGQVLTKDSTKTGGFSWETPSGGSGSVDITKLTGVIIEKNGVYPSRPTGYANVKFIGVNDPGSVAQDGDEWVKL